MYTVKELKEALAQLPDDATVTMLIAGKSGEVDIEAVGHDHEGTVTLFAGLEPA